MSRALESFSRIRRRLQPRRLLRSDAGSAAPLIAVSLPILIGSGAIAVDAAHLYSVRAELQSTADAAARAGAGSLPDTESAAQYARDYASWNMSPERHGEVVGVGDVEFGAWDGDSFNAGSGQVNAIRVVARRDEARGNAVTLALAPVIGIFASGDFSSRNVDATAIAAIVDVSDACVLALDTSGTGIDVAGTAELNSLDCGFAANSSSSDAMRAFGNASVDIRSLHLAGGLSEGGSTTVQTTEEPQINTGRELPDPFGDRAFDDLPSGESMTAGENSTPNSSIVLEPGVYPDGFAFQGEVEMEPGVYVMEDDVTINSQADVFGEGVTILLKDSEININGTANVDLSAPDSGSTSGLVVMRQGNSGAKAHFNGTADIRFDGAVYMPESELTFNGTSDNSGCLQVIARTIQFVGTTDFNNNCERLNSTPIGDSTVALVQ